MTERIALRDKGIRGDHRGRLDSKSPGDSDELPRDRGRLNPWTEADDMNATQQLRPCSGVSR